MEPFIIEPNSDTPKVEFDKSSGIFEIKGRCFPEDASQFFSPILDWVKAYALVPNPITNFQFKLEYFNTSSSKQLYKLFVLLKEVADKTQLQIQWHYNNSDTDMLASGERYAQLLDLEFNLVED